MHSIVVGMWVESQILKLISDFLIAHVFVGRWDFTEILEENSRFLWSSVRCDE